MSPNATVEFTGPTFEGLFEVMQEADERTGLDGLTRPRRVTASEIYELHDVDEREELNRLSAMIIGPPSRQKRGLALCHKFNEMHGEPHRIGRGLLIGKERRKDGFLDRAKEFLTVLVWESERLDRHGNTIMNPQTGKVQYMSIWGLRYYTNFVCADLLPTFPFPALNTEELKAAKKAVWQHHEYLIAQYALTNNKRRTTTLYPPDIRYLIEDLFGELNDDLDVDMAIQTSALMLTFMYTGARPSSVLKTVHWADDFMRWKHLRFIFERDDEGTIEGITVIVRLVTFKGFRGDERMSIDFTIRPPVSEKHLLLDLGVMLLVHGLRQGVFGDRDLEDLLELDVVEFGCDGDCAERPVFCARASRSSISKTEPLRADAATETLAELMRTAGIATGEDGASTFYAMRRAFATQAMKHMDRADVRFLLGHQPNSTTLEQYYDMGHLDFNLTAGILGPEEARYPIDNAASYKRAINPAHVGPVLLQEALEDDPLFLKLLQTYEVLKRCQEENSISWQKLDLFKQLARRRPLSNSDLYYAIAHYKAKLQTLVRSIKTDQYKDEFERQRRERLRLDYRTIRDRVKEADGPSPLAKALLKKVAEMELTMLDDDDIELNGDNHTQTVRLGARDAEGDDHLDEEDEEVVWSDDEELDQDDDFEVDGEGSEHTDTTDREGDPRGTKVESTTTKLAQQATAADRVPRRKAASRDEPVPPSLQQRLSEGLNAISLAKALDGLLSPHEYRPCALCQSDETAAPEDKRLEWTMGVKYKRHQVQFHEDFPHSNRWLRSFIEGSVWRCPFGQDQSPLRVQGRHTHCPWTTGSTHLPRAIKHLVQMHLEDLPVDLQYALHPDGRQHAKATVTRRLKELGINDHGAPTTTKSSTSAQGKGDELSDLDDLSDDEHGAAYADLPEDRIPSGLVDTDGLLIRT